MKEYQKRAAPAPSASLVRPVVLAYCLAYVPHAAWLPLPVTLWCALFWAWAWFAAGHARRMPAQKTRNILTLVGLLLATGSGFALGNGFGTRLGVGMLAALLGLKPLEVQTRESALSALCLSLFLAVFGVFHSESLLTGAYILLTLLCVLALLIRANAPGSRTRQQFFLAARLMLHGLPLALVLFFVCPRLPFGLFGTDRENTATGLQETLKMGDLGRLAANQNVVFRAKFQGTEPRPEQLYWRGLALWDFDGQKWSRPKDLPEGPSTLRGHTPVHYELHLEPSTSRWLYALDMPLSAAPGSRFFLDHTLRSRFDLGGGRRLRLYSFLFYNTGQLRLWARRHGLRLPRAGNPRTRTLAQEWARQAKSPAVVVARALQFFESNGFSYTFNPPLLPETDVIDAFLFETKTGYCSHFASAMAFLLRAAGVPSRIVLGYLGAETNPIGAYLIVRQAYAHAWNEVWLPGKGWVRVDPTATVSPERVELGPLLYQVAGNSALFSSNTPGVRTMLHSWDAMTFYWERVVLSYGYYRQRALLARLGIRPHGLRGVLQGLALMLGAVLLGCALMYALWRLRTRPSPNAADPAQRQYARFCAKLARAGLPKPPGQGPQAYAAHLAALRPAQADAVRRITDCYITLRYGPPLPKDAAKKLLQQLRQAVADFSV